METGRPTLNWYQSAAARDLLHSIAPSRGQKPGPGWVVRRVQRDCQGHTQSRRSQSLDPRDNAHRRDRDLPVTQAADFVRSDSFDGFANILEVEQGLAHSHEDHRLKPAAGGP